MAAEARKRDSLPPWDADPNELVRVRDIQFPFALWDNLFGPYPWFVAPFLGLALHELSIQPSVIHREFLVDAIGLVPSSWKERFPWGQWDAISAVQFRNCVIQQPVRLDKALLSIAICWIAAAELLKTRQSTHTYFGARTSPYWWIFPSIFVVDDLEKMFSSESLSKEISSRVNQDQIFLSEARQGLPMIEYVAHNIVGVCNSPRYGGNLNVRMLRRRKDQVSGRSLRPIEIQSVGIREIDDVRAFYA